MKTEAISQWWAGLLNTEAYQNATPEEKVRRSKQVHKELMLFGTMLGELMKGLEASSESFSFAVPGSTGIVDPDALQEWVDQQFEIYDKDMWNEEEKKPDVTEAEEAAIDAIAEMRMERLEYELLKHNVNDPELSDADRLTMEVRLAELLCKIDFEPTSPGAQAAPNPGQVTNSEAAKIANQYIRHVCEKCGPPEEATGVFKALLDRVDQLMHDFKEVLAEPGNETRKPRSPLPTKPTPN